MIHRRFFCQQRERLDSIPASTPETYPFPCLDTLSNVTMEVIRVPRLPYFPFLLFSPENFHFFPTFFFRCLRSSFDTLSPFEFWGKIIVVRNSFSTRDRGGDRCEISSFSGESLIEHSKDVLNYSNAKTCDISRGFDNFFNPARCILSRRYSILSSSHSVSRVSFFFFFYSIFPISHESREKSSSDPIRVDLSPRKKSIPGLLIAILPILLLRKRATYSSANDNLPFYTCV